MRLERESHRVVVFLRSMSSAEDVIYTVGILISWGRTYRSTAFKEADCQSHWHLVEVHSDLRHGQSLGEDKANLLWKIE
jgi:hypothetical protein